MPDNPSSTVPSSVALDRAALTAGAGPREPEWLVANGLGGYAFGPVVGGPARTYHGLLVATLRPPVERTVLISGLDEAAGEVPLDGASLESFRLDGMLPVWRHRVGGAVIERRLWMTADASATSIRYELVEGSSPVALSVVPLVTIRDHHSTTAYPDNARPVVTLARPRVARVALVRPQGPVVLAVEVGSGSIVVEGPGLGRWRRNLRLAEERARGQAYRTSAFAALRIEASLAPGRSVTVSFSVDSEAGSLEATQARQAELIERAGAADAARLVGQLVLAADQFLVRRSIPAPTPEDPKVTIVGRSVIAGYPWFNDWGRDTMIALPGLTLATGRFDEAATILRSFDRFRRDGLLPNSFPDRAGDEPAYHTIDATLWFPQALAAYEAASGDRSLVDALLPGIFDSLERHVGGTRFGIAMDPADGLIRGGAPGHQLTWMDAKVDDWVVTPRAGKPVEIQGLWFNALSLASRWLRERGRGPEADRWDALADRAQASFAARFVSPERGHLADVVDGPDGDDWSLRPNQLLAMSLPHPIIGGEAARRALATCRAELLTPLGLRSLAPSDPRYRPAFQGTRRERDAAYHNGAVWSWLIGPYVDAVLALTGDRAHARDVLAPFERHLSEAGLGTISENADPEPPFTPRGCVAQAWGVAEVLRCLRLLELPEPSDAARRRAGIAVSRA
ncbi:MAG: glycogen debranching enzyme family protein [Chloroflexi bacterium]|nr:glycogen debranching enzyme family protein [Chloroflexota bacterium]